VQVGGSTRETIEVQDGPDGVVCAPYGHRHTQACIDLCTNVHACAELINAGMNAHTRAHKCLRPPAQVVTLFFCSPAIIDFSMIQVKRDPPVPLTFACERGIEGLVDGCPVVQLPPCTTSLIRGSMAAHPSCKAQARARARKDGIH
jgi:hypothetical protein